jgi:hypothetical protein
MCSVLAVFTHVDYSYTERGASLRSSFVDVPVRRCIQRRCTRQVIRVSRSLIAGCFGTNTYMPNRSYRKRAQKRKSLPLYVTATATFLPGNSASFQNSESRVWHRSAVVSEENEVPVRSTVRSTFSSQVSRQVPVRSTVSHRSIQARTLNMRVVFFSCTLQYRSNRREPQRLQLTPWSGLYLILASIKNDLISLHMQERWILHVGVVTLVKMFLARSVISGGRLQGPYRSIFSCWFPKTLRPVCGTAVPPCLNRSPRQVVHLEFSYYWYYQCQ